MTRYSRIEVVTQSEVEDEIFLVTPDGQEIFHLDAMASAIWRILEQPMERAELLALFRSAFPGVEEDRLVADLDAALDHLLGGGLLLPQDS